MIRGAFVACAVALGASGLAGRSAAAAGPAVLIGAGDIADCRSDADERTAALLDTIEGTVFTTGDHAYPRGTAAEFARCYAPSWGRHRARTRPAPGNHDYATAQASGYFGYFGALAGAPGRGYYSYELGGWQLLVLDSNVAADAGSPQERWLRSTLEQSGARCTLAYWHHPRFSSGPHGDAEYVGPLWTALYEHGAEVVLAGHDHGYERFAPQSPEGKLDPERGIREFVVGTGGRRLHHSWRARANSELRFDAAHGLLRLDLLGDGYRWEFLRADGAASPDRGAGRCHD